MGRKKKLINNTNIPQYAIERFARCVFDDIRAAYEDEEIQKEFAEWQAESFCKPSATISGVCEGREKSHGRSQGKRGRVSGQCSPPLQASVRTVEHPDRSSQA